MEYFAKITEPKNFRIRLMTIARDDIILLKKLEDFAELRKIKVEMIQSLKKDFEELRGLSKTLDELLSDKTIREEVAAEIKKFRLKDAEERKQRMKEEKERKREIILQRLENSKIEHKSMVIPVSRPAPRPAPSYVPKPEPIRQTKPGMTDADRLAYTLDKIEAKLAELSK